MKNRSRAQPRLTTKAKIHLGVAIAAVAIPLLIAAYIYIAQ